MFIVLRKTFLSDYLLVVLSKEKDKLYDPGPILFDD